MADDPKPDPEKPDADPDAGAKKALDDERRARRDAEKQLKDIQAKLKDLEDKDKSDNEKLAARAAEAERKVVDAEAKVLRFEVAGEKGLTPAQARRLVGTTKEELLVDADDLLEALNPAGNGGGGAGGALSRPKENLKGGGDPTEKPEVTDPRKLAELVPRR